MSEQEIELKPCPFCGQQPTVIHHDIENEGLWCEWEIRCDHGREDGICGNKDDRWCSDVYYGGDKLETISKLWNTCHERTCQKGVD